MESNITRQSYIDVLKGIGIIYVVLGHITHMGFLRDYIWNFHMPLFFFISGWLYNKEKYTDFRVLFISKLKTIYLPYVFFFIITFLYWIFIERKVRGGEFSVFHQFVGLFYGTYEGFHLNFNGALWFLPCLFAVELMFYFVAKLKNNIYILYSFAIFFSFGFILNEFGLNFLPFGLHTAFFGVIFYGLGYLSRNSTNIYFKIKNSYKYAIFILGVVIQLVLTHFYAGHIEKTTIWYILIAILGVFVYVNFSMLINNNKILEFLGKNSLIILAFQEQTYRAVIFLFSKIFMIDTEIIRTNIVFCLIITVVCLLIITPMILLYNKYIRKGINSLFPA